MKHRNKKSLNGLFIFFNVRARVGYLSQKRGMKEKKQPRNEGKKKPRHPLYNDACAMFTEHGMTCAAIADNTGLTEATLSKWRKDMDWDKLREEILVRPDRIRDILMKELKSVAEGNKASIDTDALSKINKTLQYFDGKLSLPIIVAALKECDNFIMTVDPKKALEICEYHKAFILYRAKMESLK